VARVCFCTTPFVLAQEVNGDKALPGMISIPAGEFSMGSELPGSRANENPNQATPDADRLARISQKKPGVQ
jgi:formylglycine-generating enzyme required for sulfatase activity